MNHFKSKWESFSNLSVILLKSQCNIRLGRESSIRLGRESIIRRGWDYSSHLSLTHLHYLANETRNKSWTNETRSERHPPTCSFLTTGERWTRVHHQVSVSAVSYFKKYFKKWMQLVQPDLEEGNLHPIHVESFSYCTYLY